MAVNPLSLKIVNYAPKTFYYQSDGTGIIFKAKAYVIKEETIM